MESMVVLIILGVIAGAVAWIVIVLRKYQARKRFEKEREEKFLDELKRAPPPPAAVAPVAAPVDGGAAPA